jgi:hypothetical protein
MTYSCILKHKENCNVEGVAAMISGTHKPLLLTYGVGVPPIKETFGN